MDPNACLSEIRQLVAKLDEDDGETEDYVYDAEDLCNAVRGLDEWLSKGGFLPTAWQR